MVSIYCKNCIYDDVDTVLFDKDGTLIDAHLYWGRIIQNRVFALIDFYKIKKNYFDELCLALGYDTKKKRLAELGPIALLPRCDVINSLKTKLETIGLCPNDCELENIFDRVHENFKDDIYGYLSLLAGVQDLISSFKARNLKLAVITSDSYENTVKTLDFLKIIDYFDLIMGKDNSKLPKRTGEPAILAIEKLGSDPQNTICIGDTKMDADMAKNAKIKGSILVSTGQIPFETLKEYSKFTIKSLTELKIR